MARWRQQAFAPIFSLAFATMLLIVGDAAAQMAPSVAKVGGAWDTTWGGGRAMLELSQNGAVVTGTYSGTNAGKVKGTLAGNVLTGTWLGAANDRDGFVLEFKADGRSFTGTWGMNGSKTDGGPWVGARK